MRSRLEIVLLLSGLLCAEALSPRPVLAQACEDEGSMVESYRKDLSELVVTTRKESLEQFEKAFHQKTCLTKLSLCLSMVNELISCLDKAAQDSTATKAQTDAYKAKREPYANFKDTITEDRKLLKAAETPKDAKSLIQKFDLSK